MKTRQKIYLPFKRVFGFLCALLAIVVFCWLYLFIAIAIKLESKGPVFFKQDRIGINKSIFKVLKFRTMRIDTPHNVPTHLLENPEQYITKVGKFLRITSLDEIPQVFNILKGDMAIVGPRPALWNQDDLVAERDKYHANDIVPGMTGLAQVKGRDTLEIPVKAKYDGDYYDKFGFFFDIKLLFMTIISVFKHDGIKEGKN